MGTIQGSTDANGSSGSLATGTTVQLVNSPQALEQTLQNQESAHGEINASIPSAMIQTGPYHQENQRRVLLQRPMAQHVSGNRLTASMQNHQRITQAQSASKIPASDSNVQYIANRTTHFNYNPIYNGLNNQDNHQKQQQQSFNDGQQQSSDISFMSPDDLYIDDNDDDDHDDTDNDAGLLNEIYQFTEEVEKKTSNNIRTSNVNPLRHHQQTQQAQFLDINDSSQPRTHLTGSFGNQSDSLQVIQTNHSIDKLKLFNQNSLYQHDNSKSSSRSKASAYGDNQCHLMINFQQPSVQNNSTNSTMVHEDCGGLFVEYQTNQNLAGGSGGLEELHSLNVTNCDSETLEEQINLLSQDTELGAFDNGGSEIYQHDVEYQDYGSNDLFLNMLMNSNHHSVSQNVDPLSNNQQQQLLPQSTQQQQQGTAVQVGANPLNTNKQHTDSQMVVSKRSGSKSMTANQKGSRSSCKSNKSVIVDGKAKLIDDQFVQQTIATTNTNKQLLPRKTIGPNTLNGKSRGTTTGGYLSRDTGEDPYKQQLENLRKKLRMDLGPNVTLTSCAATAGNKQNKETPA